jgi:CubicO group peptidase (beta-lactamase class C family)
MMVLALGLLAGDATAQETLESRIAAVTNPFVKAYDFSGAFAVRSPTDSVDVAVGWSDLSQGLPNTTMTRFGIGSVSKQFTAALILRLVEGGMISLDDTIQAFLPETAGPPATVHQLLAHRSGFAGDPLDALEIRDHRTSAELLEVIDGLPREFEPGERTSYSNSGFILLALLAERLTGQPYCTALREMVLEPIGLFDTGCLDQGRIIPGLARGYDPGVGPFRLRPSPSLEWSNLLGAGNLYSTTHDLAQWGRIMLSRSFLAGPSWDAMLASYGDGRGYGVATYTRHGHLAIGHDGVTHGYTAFLEIYPDDETVVAYAGNTRTGAFELMESAVIGMALGEPIDPPESPSDVDEPVPAAIAKAVIGRYELFPGFHLTITGADERLFLQGTGGYPTVLTSKTDGGFFYRAMYATIRFDPEQGDGVLIWIDRGGQEYVAQRVGS